MPEWQALLPLAAVMLAAGLLGGLVAGLLGVGGGIVIVPVLDAALEALGVDGAVRMQVAVATSLANIVPTSIVSARAHRRRGGLDENIVRAWSAAILAGAILGAWLATQVTAAALSLLFAGLAILVGIKMMLPLDAWRIADQPPRGVLGALPPAVIGTLSSMLGIGGGTLTVPFLTLSGVPVHRAVGTSALLGLLISLPGALAFIITGWGDPRLPAGSLGYVNVAGLLFVSPATVLMAPLGARLAHSLPQRYLSLVFGAFLALVALRMLGRALGAW